MMMAAPPKKHAAKMAAPPQKPEASLRPAAPPSQKSMSPPAMKSSPPAVAKKEQAAAPAVDTVKATPTNDAGGSMNSKLGAGILTVALVCCCGAIAVVFGLFILGKKKKNTRATEREAYLKNDFIERQPMRDDVPTSQETEPMIQGEAPAPTQPSGIQLTSFPGMPTIGGGSSLVAASSMNTAPRSFAYSNQLGVTTPAPTFPQGSVV